MTNITKEDTLATIKSCAGFLTEKDHLFSEDGIDFVDSVGQILQWMGSIIKYEVLGKEFGDALLDPSESVRDSIACMDRYIRFPPSVLSYRSDW